MKTFKEIVAHRLEVGLAACARYDEFISDVMTDIAEELDLRLQVVVEKPNAAPPARLTPARDLEIDQWTTGRVSEGACIVRECRREIFALRAQVAGAVADSAMIANQREALRVELAESKVRAAELGSQLISGDYSQYKYLDTFYGVGTAKMLHDLMNRYPNDVLRVHISVKKSESKPGEPT